MREINVSNCSAEVISLVRAFSKYSVNFCLRDAINAFACWIHFVSTDAPAFDHVANGPLAHLELLGGFGGG
jgi:hypothetical protein